MSNVDFTLKDVRAAVREEIADTVPAIARTIVREEMMAERAHTEKILDDGFAGLRTEMDEGFANVGTEMDDRFASSKIEMDDGFSSVRAEVVKVRTMLEEDARAESLRLTRVEKRLLKMSHGTR